MFEYCDKSIIVTLFHSPTVPQYPIITLLNCQSLSCQIRETNLLINQYRTELDKNKCPDLQPRVNVTLTSSHVSGNHHDWYNKIRYTTFCASSESLNR